MHERLGLYEYLGVDVTGGPDDGTSATFTPRETYDDDPGLGLFDLRDGSTTHTRTDNETYDDDPGLEGLGVLDMSTDRSGSPGETYDDLGFEQLADLDHLLESTVITKVAGETHDDSGFELLDLP